MSAVEAVKRLANTDPEIGDFCFACGNDSHKHYEDCAWAVMPRLVAIVEAAERLVENDGHLIQDCGFGPWACAYCNYTGGHGDDCPLGALVDTLEENA
jgi:hypothetical protein